MKKLSIISLLILFISVLQLSVIKAQTDDDLFSFMEEHLTSDEKSQIKKAKSNIEKGDKISSQIKKGESKIKKYSKKAKKYEKKSVDIKILRIKQALYHEKGLTAIYNVYGEKVGESVFLYDDDETRVNNIQEEASDDMASGKKKLKPYKSVKEKDLKKKIKYSKLKSDLNTSFNLKTSSISKLIEAYAIYLEQETKRQLEEEENSHKSLGFRAVATRSSDGKGATFTLMNK